MAPIWIPESYVRARQCVNKNSVISANKENAMTTSLPVKIPQFPYDKQGREDRAPGSQYEASPALVCSTPAAQGRDGGPGLALRLSPVHLCSSQL